MATKTIDNSIWEQFKFEDIDNVKVQGQSNRFKLKEKGDMARIAFPLINPKTKKVALLKVLKFQYTDKATGSWATFQAPSDQNSEAYKIAVKYCGEPQIIYVTPVLVYSTNKEGRVINGEEYELQNLTLPKQRLQEIKALQSEYDLSLIDLIATCTEPKFQNIKFNPAKECGFTDGSITYRKGDKERTIKIVINPDEVIAEAFEMAKESDLAVAPKWGEQYIIDYFTKSNEDFDEDIAEEEDDPTPTKTPTKQHTNIEDDFDDDEI